MNANSENESFERALVDLNLNRNERQKCVLLRALGRHLREKSRKLVAELVKTREEGVALQEQGCHRDKH
jgi:EAL domain-containing protein (putative c-di-GMP-specific phosphodiesterase class I)